MVACEDMACHSGRGAGVANGVFSQGGVGCWKPWGDRRAGGADLCYGDSESCVCGLGEVRVPRICVIGVSSGFGVPRGNHSMAPCKCVICVSGMRRGDICTPWASRAWHTGSFCGHLAMGYRGRVVSRE